MRFRGDEVGGPRVESVRGERGEVMNTQTRSRLFNRYQLQILTQYQCIFVLSNRFFSFISVLFLPLVQRER